MEFLRGLKPEELLTAAIALSVPCFLLACMCYVQGKGYIVFGILFLAVIVLALSAKSW